MCENDGEQYERGLRKGCEWGCSHLMWHFMKLMKWEVAS